MYEWNIRGSIETIKLRPRGLLTTEQSADCMFAGVPSKSDKHNGATQRLQRNW